MILSLICLIIALILIGLILLVHISGQKYSALVVGVNAPVHSTMGQSAHTLKVCIIINDEEKIVNTIESYSVNRGKGTDLIGSYLTVTYSHLLPHLCSIKIFSSLFFCLLFLLLCGVFGVIATY